MHKTMKEKGIVPRRSFEGNTPRGLKGVNAIYSEQEERFIPFFKGSQRRDEAGLTEQQQNYGEWVVSNGKGKKIEKVFIFIILLFLF